MAKKKKIKQKQAQPMARPTFNLNFMQNLLDSKYYVLYYAIFILLLTVILFSEFAFSGEMLHSSDGINASLYFRQFWKDHVSAFAEVPQWSPLIFCGMPFVDAFHSDIFYPVTFPFKMILPIPQAFGWAMLFHIFLAGLLMYLCCRAFRLSKLSSSIAGIFYMFAPYLASMVQPGHDGKMYVTALLPLAMLFLERGMNNRRFLDFVLLGGSIGLIILTPHPQMSYFSLWGLAFYAAFRIIFRVVKDKNILIAIRPALYFVIAVALGLFISAIQFYPSYKYVKEFSPRAESEQESLQEEEIRYAYATSWSMNAGELVSQFIPNFIGTNATKYITGERMPPTYWGKNAFKDNSEYIGVLPLLLGMIAVIFVRNKRTWFFFGLGLFTLIYALGASTPLFKIFYYGIPNVKHLRAPSMIMFMFSFSFCLLAAFGVDYIRNKLPSENPDRRRKVELFAMIVAIAYAFAAFVFTVGGEAMMRLFKSIFNPGGPQGLLQYRAFPNIPDVVAGLWIVTIILAIAYFIIKLVGRRRIGLTVLAVLAVLGMVDAWRMNLKFITTEDPDQFFAPNNVVQRIKSVDKPYVDRILNTEMAGVIRSSNYFAYHGIPMMFGYHGNQMKIFDQYWARQGKSNDHSYIYRIYYNRENPQDPRNGQLVWFNIPFASMAGVKYLVCNDWINLGEYQSMLRPLSTTQEVRSDRLILYENPFGFDRVRIFHDFIVKQDHQEALDFLREMNHDYERVVVLEDDPGIEAIPDADTTGEIAQIRSYEPNEIIIDVKLNSDGILYMADCWYPAWKAYVDDEESPVILANTTFRGIPVKAGEHEVRVIYESAIFETSKNITYAASIFVIGVLGFNVYTHRRRGKNSSE